ncbi:RNA-binding KH domain-containing protein [Striga asiatica]|uniref:RNA-binding KH domain-containing protein n=1 Tax=Striga asiatica TaxID=4170 RepID=A0A5A7PJH8_STRAF|nr:RNA-binding KH domain-containing protein [Striga asiatica]
MGQRGDYAKGSYTMSDFPLNQKEQNTIGPDDTVYRYLCPLRKIGSIIGIGGDIARQLRAQTHSRIRISETIPGCDERVVTIYSPSEETNTYEDEPLCPAQDALLRVHDKVMAAEDSPPVNGSFEETVQVVVRLLVPSDQIGCVIGKGGQIIKGIRNETHAQVRILGSEHLPPCALSSDELIQINGEATVVKEALYQVAFRLHDNPSRSQLSLLSLPSIYKSGISLNNSHAAPTSLMGPYGGGNHKYDGRDWSSIPREFMLRLVCPTQNLGAVIGKGGATIKQIRQETGAFIVVDSNGADGDDCIISVSSKEMLEAPSRTIDAIIRLQSRCSERVECNSNELVITTRLLVPSHKVGCIIGKGGAIIKEMRSTSRANIRVFADENVPKVAAEDDEMVQITGDLNAAKNALLQVIQRLRTNTFETDGSLPAFSNDAFNGHKYVNRDNRTHNSGYSAYSGGYGSNNLPPTESYDSYDESQVVSGSGYGAYGVYSSGDHSTGAG